MNWHLSPQNLSLCVPWNTKTQWINFEWTLLLIVQSFWSVWSDEWKCVCFLCRHVYLDWAVKATFRAASLMDDCTHRGEKHKFPLAVLTLRLVHFTNQWQNIWIELLKDYSTGAPLLCLTPLSQLNPWVTKLRALCAAESTSSIMMHAHPLMFKKHNLWQAAEGECFLFPKHGGHGGLELSDRRENEDIWSTGCPKPAGRQTERNGYLNHSIN